LKVFFVALFLFSTFPCGAAEKWRVLKAEKAGPESILPPAVIDAVKKEIGKEVGKEASSEKEKTAFMTVEVFLWDHHGVVDPPVKVITSVGGGRVDLSRLLPTGKASVQLRVRLLEGGEEISVDKVFFIPQLSEVKDGKEQNCGKYFEITHYFKKISAEDGVKTYLTRGIYASSFVGTYVFVKKGEKETALAHLSLVDDRFEGRRCSLTASKEAPAK